MTEKKKEQSDVVEKKSDLSSLKNLIEGRKEPKITEPSVEITKLKLAAIEKLADNTNQAFSEMTVQETLDVSKALAFADDPLPDINLRLMRAGVVNEDGSPVTIKLPVLEKFIVLQLKHRHSTDRKRVEEFIRALRAMNPQMGSDDERKGLLTKRPGSLI